jgi:broad specificity phosphatase PhoE
MVLSAYLCMGTLYLIRHARPAVEGRLLGQSDPPLSKQGRDEARLALAGIEVGVVYSSPLRRALETALFLRPAPEVTVLDQLAEISLGTWDGQTWEEVECADPQLARRKRDDWFNVTPPRGESWAAFSDRVLSGLDSIQNGIMPAAIVAHLAVNAVIAAKLAGTPPAQFRQAYCEVIELDV